MLMPLENKINDLQIAIWHCHPSIPIGDHLQYDFTVSMNSMNRWKLRRHSHRSLLPVVGLVQVSVHWNETEVVKALRGPTSH